jgi:hypothetical protein
MDFRRLSIGLLVTALLVACSTSGSGCPSYLPVVALPPQPSGGNGGPASQMRRPLAASAACPAPPVRTPLPSLPPRPT